MLSDQVLVESFRALVEKFGQSENEAIADIEASRLLAELAEPSIAPLPFAVPDPA